MVYTVAELNAAGISSASTINEIGFYVANKPIYDIPGYTISLKHTDESDASGNLNNGYTVVVNSHTFIGVSGGWNMMTCDNPFDWNGAQNIAVQVCWSQVMPNWDPSGQVRTIAATDGYRYRRDDNTGSACGNNPDNILDTKPQIRFVFETETVWNGSVSTDWFNASNWSADIPNQDMDARIPADTPNDPAIVGLAECNLLTLEGKLDLTAASRINIYGDFVQNGTLNDNGGTTTFSGLGSNVLTNNTTLEFSTLNCESKGGVTMNGNDIVIKTSLAVQKSTLNTNNLVTIRSDAIATGRIDELITNCFYTLNMTDTWGDGWNGGFLEIFEDGVSIGTYSATDADDTESLSLGNGSTIDFVYTSGTYENENAYTISDPGGAVVFTDGTSPATGTVFTTVPNCGFTDPITGEVVVERYIDAGETYWRSFSSGVQNATLAQFNDDFTTAGYPGSLFPNFGWVSAYNYDETLGPSLGYLETTGGTQEMDAGEGWQIWCGDTITGTQPFVFDLRGVPNQGDIAMPVTYTNTGTPTEDGWNFVGNPYASTIDWDDADWTKTNMANAVYIQNPDNQQYATYVAGASTNGGSRYIASQQGFWVLATGASPVLTAREGVKSNVDQAFFKNGNDFNPGMTIRVQGVAEFDEAVLRHLNGAEEEFEFAYDAQKIWGGWGVYPQISLLNSELKDLTVHTIDKGSQEWSIPLRVVVFESGTYNLEFENIGELDVPCLQLEDTYDGSVYSIESGVNLPFELSDTTFAARFILHLGKSYESAVTAVSCNGDDDGSITLDFDLAATVDYQITFGINAIDGNGYGNPLVIENLESGIYSVEVPSLTNTCDQTAFNFVVPEPAPLAVTENVITESLGGDAAILVELTGGQSPYLCLWNNGSVNQSISGLTAGTYILQVEDGNGCELSASFVVDSELAISTNLEENNIYYNADYNQIMLGDHQSEDFYLVNALGQTVQVFSQKSSSAQSLQINMDLRSGVYFLVNSSRSIEFKFVK